MANLCYTEYIVKSSDKEALQKVADLINKCVSDDITTGPNAVQNRYYGRPWIGNVVIHSGIYPEGIIDVENDKYPVGVRGVIIACEILKTGDMFVSTETDWNPADGWIVDLLEKLVPEYNIDYNADYEGEYWSNYKEGYIIEYSGCNEDIFKTMLKHFHDPGSCYDGVDEDKMREFLKETLFLLGFEPDDSFSEMKISDMIDRVKEIDKDLRIFEWQRDDIDFCSGYFATNYGEKTEGSSSAASFKEESDDDKDL